MRFPIKSRAALSPLATTRNVHSSASVQKVFERRQPKSVTEDEQLAADPEDLLPFTVSDVMKSLQTIGDTSNESSSAGHLVMRQDRHVFKYLRLIENGLPKLVALRTPYTPPTSKTPLIVRSVDYAGEQHPATSKRTVVVAVAQLPLRDMDAIHKFKVLAGVRWTPDPPKDAGIGPNEVDRQHGYMKISCEDFPEPAQNLKWASDVIDRLIAEANDPKDKFRNIPLDTRHLVSRARKAKNGEHRPGQIFHRPSIRDFPKEWLPESTEQLSVPKVQQGLGDAISN